MLKEQRQTDGLFLSVGRGSLFLSSTEPKEGYEEVSGDVDGRPYQKWIKKFAALDGIVTNIEWEVREHDKTTFRGLKVSVKDGGEHYVLDLPYGKRPFDTFCKTAENIDFSQKVEFVAWPDREDPRQTAFAIKQDGQFVQWKYTKDNMGECPSAVQSPITGKWNFDDQREWLLNNLLTNVAPAVKAMHAFDEPVAEESGELEYTGAPPLTIKDVVMPPVDDNNAPTPHPSDCGCPSCQVPF
jgi:hypothetical protein